HRGEGPRHRRLQGRADHRHPRQGRRCGQRRGPADHAGERQGDDGRARALGRHGPSGAGAGRRPRQRRHADRAPRGQRGGRDAAADVAAVATGTGARRRRTAHAPAGRRPDAGGDRSRGVRRRAARLLRRARRTAREMGVDLTKVGGTGEKGRITKDDIMAYLRGPGPAPAGAPAAAAGAGIPEIPAQDFSKFGPIETKPLSRIKRLSGPFLHRSWLNVPHVTQNDEADITETDAYRKELDTAGKEKGYRVTLLAFLIKASVSVLKQHPEFNASLSPEKDALIYKRYYNIGVAVDTPDGLVVPVVKDADRKGIVEISQELGAISKKARDGKLSPTD